MSFSGYPYGVTVTLSTRAVVGRDADGNDVYGDTAADVRGCLFDPGGSVELVDGRDTVVTRPAVYLPAGTAVTAVDRVSVAGRLYDVDGTPRQYRSGFTGWAPGPVIGLKEVTG